LGWKLRAVIIYSIILVSSEIVLNSTEIAFVFSVIVFYQNTEKQVRFIYNIFPFYLFND